MKKIIPLLFFAIFAFSCVEETSTFKTFTGDMIYSYLKKDTSYSECVEIIDRAGLKGMLSAYGGYTFLAPTNKAFRRYYAQQGKGFNIDSLREGQIDTIARTHIVVIKLFTSDLTEGVIPNVNMDQRFIEVNFTSDTITSTFKIMLNDSSQIVSRDNEVYNGVVHGIDRLIQPSIAVLPALIAKNKDISIFSEALILTHLRDSLLLIKDETYKPSKIFKDEYDNFVIVNPKERRYGYTAFIEDNDLLRSYGINSLQDLIAKANELYPSGKGYENDFTNRKNSLNQYIAYHLINKAIYYNKFFYTRNTINGYVPDEFIETMLSNRILRASFVNRRITFNWQSDFTAKVREIGAQTTVNGLYHLLDEMLVYSPGVESMLQNTRIRFDIVSLFPEMINNNIRASEGFMSENNSSGDRFGFEVGYLTGIKSSSDTRLIYMSAKNGQWGAFQADEFHGLGAYDITIKLLPVPPGTYELRFGYSAWDGRSVTQIYIDGKPVGIPLDLKITADNPKVGSLLDENTDDDGVENDKMMRNRGYMKAPNTVFTQGMSLRNIPASLRRIIGTFTFTEYAPHTIRYKSVDGLLNKQCEMDYFEFVPKSIFNPASGEPEARD
jgi:uncharacterized surface protein with fasciclin (FAS1) repeats